MMERVSGCHDDVASAADGLAGHNKALVLVLAAKVLGLGCHCRPCLEIASESTPPGEGWHDEVASAADRLTGHRKSLVQAAPMLVLGCHCCPCLEIAAESL